MEEIKIYTTREVADILKITERTLYNYIKAKQIQPVKVGKYWRFTAETIKEFMERGTSL